MSFKDVYPVHWGSGYIEAVQRAGLMNGVWERSENKPVVSDAAE
ncbi:hypothetical protein D7Z26_24830 [Cohnella endophytica]|uniref:SLH domain-containing protein n=1 Tax=Cohnella endophytica TaxID=2419778 RepID=A0A494X7P3_9BACL|nr:hypothetical protein D7Z26_24830 [Cohnella endophytica]